MRRQEFDSFIAGFSKQFPVSMIAKNNGIERNGSGAGVPSALPILDALEIMAAHDYLYFLDVADRVVLKEYFLKRPLRIIFFFLLTEIESKLYRIQEWSKRPVEELNEKNMNDFIRWLLDNETLIGYQTVYSDRAEFKEDLKAVSSLRNLIVHVNKKLELQTDFCMMVKRKKQLFKLIDALEQICEEWSKVKM